MASASGSDLREGTTLPATEIPASEQPISQTPAEPSQKQQADHDEDDDDDSDLDDLDDVLDDFSKPKPVPAPAAPASAPAAEAPSGDFDEDAFLKQLEQDMANMMSNPGAMPMDSNLASVEEGADLFAKQLGDSGIEPGDFLKQLLADVMAEEKNGADAKATPSDTTPARTSADTGVSASDSGEQPTESFNDAIQRTMERMKHSGDRATEAATEDDGLSDDMIAQLLKAMEAGAAGAGDDGDLSKMFMGMMEQLSNKEMLYEPMKELDGKFAPWIEKNKVDGKVPAEDMARYETQAKVVGQIVRKFEETGYSDDDPKCREYVWERMQEMQAAGSPPEELISNPLMDMGDLGGAGAAAAAGGVPDCPQQ